MTIKEKTKKKKNKCWQECGKSGTLILLEGIQNGVAALVDILVVPQNVKLRIII